MTLLQKVPDRFVVLGRKSEVAAAPLRTPQPRDNLVCRTADDFVAGGGEFDGFVFTDGAGQFAKLVGVVPVHPVTQSNRLLGLPGGVAEHTVLASIGKPIEPQSFHFLFGGQSEFFFDLDFNPQTLAIEPVLKSLRVTAHRVKTLKCILVGSPPSMVDPHRIVGRDRSIHEAPLRAFAVFRSELLEYSLLPPKPQHLVFALNES